MVVDGAEKRRTRSLDARIFNQQKVLEETSILGISLGERVESRAEEERRHEPHHKHSDIQTADIGTAEN